MKKTLILGMLFVLLGATSAMASIVNSRHNLGSGGLYTYHSDNTGTSEICIFCHTPHNAIETYPLWNRSNPVGAAFQFYSSESAQMTGIQNRSFTTDSISLFCMSCHDGTTGLFSAVVRKFGESYNGTSTLGGYAAIADDGSSLTNDHPVNFSYDTTKTKAAGDTFFASEVDVKANGLRLYGASNFVECASCHDPHLITFGKFLRKSNNSSNLCLTCHKK